MRSTPSTPISINRHVDYTYLYFKVFQSISLDTKTEMCFYEGGMEK